MLIETMCYLLALVFGLLIGNYSTTALYRLPRGITMCGFNKTFTTPPFCSYCSHPLKPWEYLPLISWFNTFGKCNYCGHKINKVYTILEILMSLISVILYHLVGFNDSYILLVLFSAVCCIMGFVCLEHQGIQPYLTVGAVLLGGVYFTLQDHTIDEWILRVALAAILVMVMLKSDSNFLRKRTPAHIILISCTWLAGIGYLLIYLIFGLGLQLITISILQKRYSQLLDGDIDARMKSNSPQSGALDARESRAVDKKSDTNDSPDIITGSANYYTRSLAIWFFWLIIMVIYQQTKKYNG